MVTLASPEHSARTDYRLLHKSGASDDLNVSIRLQNARETRGNKPNSR